MEKSNGTSNEFPTRISPRDVSIQALSNILNFEEQTKTQIATLQQETKNLQSELQEH